MVDGMASIRGVPSLADLRRDFIHSFIHMASAHMYPLVPDEVSAGTAAGHCISQDIAINSSVVASTVQLCMYVASVFEHSTRKQWARNLFQ